tara:strand:+ start:233 stop:436 length:204 start_codon:yes stop_codon:yes gene_type:complete
MRWEIWMRLHAVEIAKDKMYAFSVWDTEDNLVSLYTGNKSYIRQKIALVNRKMAKEKQNELEGEDGS